MGWDDALDGFTTHPLKGELRLGLKIPQLSLVLIEGKAMTSSPWTAAPTRTRALGSARR